MAANAAFFSAAAFFCSFWDRFQDQKRNKYYFHIHKNSSDISMLLTSVLKNRSYSIARKSVTLCLATRYLTPEKYIYLLGCSVFYKIGYFLSWSKRYPHFLQVINCTHQLQNKTTNIHKVHLITFLVTYIISFCQMKLLKNILQSYRNYKKIRIHNT